MISKVAGYIAEHELLSMSEKYLVAVSGGADSVALLLVLHRLGYHVEAVHCNFHLRGAESDRDEQFVTGLCKRMDISLHKAHFDTAQYAQLHKQSIEFAARNLRYSYFRQLSSDIGATAVCVAHHRDDVVETVLMNMVRGTGIHGMVGIRPRNGNVIRPLLCVSREEIERYLAVCRQDYVTDSTNLEDDATRNVFRHHVVPLLSQINPGAADNIARTAGLMLDVEKIFDAEIEHTKSEIMDGNNIAVDKLLSHPVPETVLYEIVSLYGFTGSQVACILRSVKEGAVGKLFYSASSVIVTERNRIEIGPRDLPDFVPVLMPVEGVYLLPDSSRLRIDVLDIAVSGISKKADAATVDAGKITFPLTLRRVQTGDRFRPFGMSGTKLVSDFMTDIKCSYLQKREQLVVADATGTIVWLVGRRVSEVCRVSPSTEKVLRISKE